MPAIITPAVNETLAPYQFDSVVTVGGGQVSGAPVGPADLAYKAWNFPSWLATGTGTFSLVGSVYLTAVHLTAQVTYSNIYLNSLSTGGAAGLTAGSNFAGVYNSAGTLVATTADLTGVTGTGTLKVGLYAFPLSTALTPAASAPYYVGMFFNAGGTASFPVLAGVAGQTAANMTTLAGQVANCGGISATTPTVAAPFPFAAVATTSATAMPGTFALGSAGTTGAQCFWVGLA